MELLKRAWYRFSESKISILGFAIVLLFFFMAFFGKTLAPYPEHGGAYYNFEQMNRSPCKEFLLGTDFIGRDILSRLMISIRNTLLMSILVLSIATPIGFLVGVVAGYYRGTLLDTLLMRITDIFLSIPPLVLALAIAAVLKPTLMNSMLAITVMWWPWYARLVYGVASSLKTENYIVYAQLTGANIFHIIFKEILPNCISPILTKMTLDIGYVIVMGATLSFAGLGEQPPAPALGNMIADGVKYMPEQWWLAIFPALTITIIVLGFNLFGDGISNLFSTEES